MKNIKLTIMTALTALWMGLATNVSANVPETVLVYCDEDYCYFINNECEDPYCGLIPIPRVVVFDQE